MPIFAMALFLFAWFNMKINVNMVNAYTGNELFYLYTEGSNNTTIFMPVYLQRKTKSRLFSITNGVQYVSDDFSCR